MGSTIGYQRDDEFLSVKQLGQVTIQELLLRATEREHPVQSRNRFSPQSRTARKITFLLSDIVAAGAAGLIQNVPGVWVLLSASSHAAARLEVAWDDSTAEAQWYPLVPGGKTKPPSGSQFTTFRVRVTQTAPAVPSLAVPVFMLVSGDEYGVLDDQSRTGNVTPAGSTQTLTYLTTLAGGEIAAAGSDEGAVPIAGWDGAAYARFRSVTPGATNAATAGTQDVLARLYLWDGSTWGRAALTTPADDVAAAAGLATWSQLAAYDGATFDRLRSVTPADNVAATAGTLDTWARLALYDGTNWDRARTSGGAAANGGLAVTIQGASTTDLAIVNNNGDAQSQGQQLYVKSITSLYNGSTHDRARSGVGDVATGVARTVPAVARTSAATQTAVGLAEANVAAANTSRKRLVVKADPDNAGKIFVGLTGVVAGTGFELNAGQELEITTDDSIYCIASLAAQNVSCWEETW